MASPWITPQPQRSPAERPWLGFAMLAAIPLLSLILLRLLWSGSGLWFLTLGIIALGGAAVAFLGQRSNEQQYGRPTLAQEPSRLPLFLLGAGVLLLALLILPNFSGDDSDSGPAVRIQDRLTSPGLDSQVSGVSQPPAQQPTAVQQPRSQAPVQQEPAQPSTSDSATTSTDATLEEGQVYVVQEGDTLWDIADRFSTTVDAIVAANDLENPEDLQIGQELIIPPPSDEEAAPVEGE